MVCDSDFWERIIYGKRANVEKILIRNQVEKKIFGLRPPELPVSVRPIGGPDSRLAEGSEKPTL